MISESLSKKGRRVVAITLAAICMLSVSISCVEDSKKTAGNGSRSSLMGTTPPTVDRSQTGLPEGRMTFPLLEIDRPVSFAVGETGAALIKSGFSSQEEKHIWTEGKHASIGFRLPPSAKDLLMIVDAVPLAPTHLGDDQFCDVVMNGEKIGTWKLTGFSGQPYRVRLPNHLIPESGDIEVSFRFNKVGSPREIPGSLNMDSRLLGLAFRELVVAHP